MKDNERDLFGLQALLDRLIALDVLGCSVDLKDRLDPFVLWVCYLCGHVAAH
jgi:hypothetical protein